MPKVITITGLDKILLNMKKVEKDAGSKVARGLKKAGAFLLRESQAIVPVDKGILKASGFVRAFGVGFKTDVIVGYTAGYAVYVHENLEAVHGAAFNIKYAAMITDSKNKKQVKQYTRGPNQQAKFLEAPCRTKRGEIIDIIKQEVLK